MFKSIKERDSLEAELQSQGYATRQLSGLCQPQYGFYRKPNGEIVRLPIGADRLAFYQPKGFVYLAAEGETTLEELRNPPKKEPKPRRKIKHRKSKQRRET